MYRKMMASTCATGLVKCYMTKKQRKVIEYEGTKWTVDFDMKKVRVINPVESDEEEAKKSKDLFLSAKLRSENSASQDNDSATDDEPQYCKIDILAGESAYSVFSFTGLLKADIEYKHFCNITCLCSQKHALAPYFYMRITIGHLKRFEPTAHQTLSVVKSYKALLDSSTLTDVIIKTSDKELPCHKLALAACSDVFRAMFEAQMKESRENMVVLVDLFDASTIEDLIYYAYTRTEPPNIASQPCGLYEAANYFQIRHLKRMCLTAMLKTIDVENSVDYLQFAEKYGEEVLKERTCDFMIENCDLVIGTDGWKNLPPESSKDLFSSFMFITKMKKQKVEK